MKKDNVKFKRVIGSFSALGIYFLCAAFVFSIFVIIMFILLKLKNVNMYMFFIQNSFLITVVKILLFNIIFGIIIKKKFVIENSSDFIQKFIIISLVVTCIGIYNCLYKSKTEIHSQFLSLQVLQPLYYDLVNADIESEFYQDYCDIDFIGEFSTYNDVNHKFLEKYEEVINSNIYSRIEDLLLNSILEISAVIVCVKLIDFLERKKDYKSIAE